MKTAVEFSGQNFLVCLEAIAPEPDLILMESSCRQGDSNATANSIFQSAGNLDADSRSLDLLTPSNNSTPSSFQEVFIFQRTHFRKIEKDNLFCENSIRFDF